jgi:S-(hydroxymethyl)glutathione dehydrogenase/alcohol dehydrogenase
VSTARAAVLTAAGGALAVTDIELAEPGPGQVRVELAATGVCHSDLSLARGTLAHSFPVVLGHEGAGTVSALGPDVSSLNIGDRVVLNWAPPCRACWFCLHDEPYLCEQAGVAWKRPHATLADGTPVYPGLGVGGFATATVVDETACIPVPADVPLVEAALLGCAVLTGVGAVLHSARVRPGQSVLVVGLGGVGLSAVQGARIAGAGMIIVVDPSAEKCDLGLRLGATHALEPGSDLPRRVRALCDRRGADHAIECVGRADTIRAAWSSTRRGGHTTVVGLGAVTDEVAFNALELGHQARTLTGCVYGSTDPATDVPLLLDHYRAGALDLAALVTAQVDLADVPRAFDDMSRGVGARTVVVPQRSGVA